MPVNDELDVTPAFTLSTLQFDNETFNVIITSALAVFIVTNIGSIISKLVYYTRRTSFRYSSWTRAFIYANSDDPIKIISWLSRKYLYRDKRWLRQPNRLKLKRLILPLLARLVMLLCSIASIAVALPGEKEINGCKSGDFGLLFERGAPIVPKPTAGVCTKIPITSRRGRVRSGAQYCDCQVEGMLNSTITGWSVGVLHSPDDGTIVSLIEQNGTFLGSESSVEWEDNTSRQLTLRTDLTQAVTLEDHISTLTRVMTTSEWGCEARNRAYAAPNANGYIQLLNCTASFSSLDATSRMSGVMRGSLHWEKRPKRQLRIEVSPDGSSARTDKCPIDIVIQRPLVNILPLAVALIGCIIINGFVSCAVGTGGNALDAAFHIINEVLGHDSTSNPLEKNVERGEFTELDLRNWNCSDGGAHVGFIGRYGDTPVKEFREGTVVCACARGTSELVNAKVLCGKKVPASYMKLASPTVSNDARPSSGAPFVSGSVYSGSIPIAESNATVSVDNVGAGSSAYGMPQYTYGTQSAAGFHESGEMTTSQHQTAESPGSSGTAPPLSPGAHGPFSGAERYFY